MTGLQTAVLAGLTGTEHDAFAKQLSDRTLEQSLSRLRRIASLLRETSDKVDGLTAAEAASLDVAVCRLIASALEPTSTDPTAMHRFAAWAARADYLQPVELFTVNYDLLLERSLDGLGVPYFDGFVGTLKARFRTDLVEATGAPGSPEVLPPFVLRLWKLHGSVNWAWLTDARTEVVRLGMAAPKHQPAAIYPSDAKYDESRRVPFVVLQDRLRRGLSQPETLTLVAGYSFADAHLNEIIFEATRRRPRSEVIAFCHAGIPDELAINASNIPNLQVIGADEAIIGGVRGGWDGGAGSLPSDIWKDDRCQLGSFQSLSQFLARSSPPHSELEARLEELLAKAVGTAGA